MGTFYSFGNPLKTVFFNLITVRVKPHIIGGKNSEKVVLPQCLVSPQAMWELAWPRDREARPALCLALLCPQVSPSLVREVQRPATSCRDPGGLSYALELQLPVPGDGERGFDITWVT